MVKPRGGEKGLADKFMRTGFGERGDRYGSGRPAPDSGAADARRKAIPPEKTHAEEYYFTKQMNGKTPMIVVLTDGETLRGWIEWYDQHCVKLNRLDAPNLLLYKHSIRYMYKDPEAEGRE